MLRVLPDVNTPSMSMNDTLGSMGIPNQAMATRLRQARIEAGFETASDASRAMGVIVPTYISHENGTRAISTARAAQYCRFFRVSIAWLVTGRGHPQGIEPPTAPVVDPLAGLSPEDREEVIRLIKFLRRRH